MNKSLILTAALLVSAAHGAERIVSTTGYASEIVVLLGKAEQLIGVDTTSMIPADIMDKKAKIGYRRQLSAEGILSLKPDLILLAPDAAPANAVTQIEGSGIALTRLKDAQTLSGIREEIALIGDAVGAKSAAGKLIARIQADEAALQTAKRQAGSGSALVLLNTGSRGVFALGKNSAGGHLLDILGLRNAVDFEGNKPMSMEAFIATPADVLLIAARDDAATAPVIAAISGTESHYQSVARTAAAQRGCAFAVNILAALGFGANTARDSAEILRAVTPCLNRP